MDWWTEVRLVMGAFLDKHGLLAAFVFLLIEEAGAPLPVPGDFVMLLLGVQARQGSISLWQSILAMEVATVIGAAILYGISRVAGRGFVYRYGRFIRLSPERLDRAETWLLTHGFRAVFLGRLLPGLRIVTAVACGVFGVSAWVFIPAMALGALVYILFYTLLGYLFGAPILAFLERLHLPMGQVGAFALLALLLFWLYRARSSLGPRVAAATLDLDHRRRLRAGSLAGLFATVGSTLLMNMLVNLAGNLAFRAPGTIVEQTAARLAIGAATELQPLLLFVAAPLFAVVGVLWGALYGAGVERKLRPPDWQKGTLFALLPLAVSLLVILPIIGMGFLGVGATGPVAAVGEVLRHAMFGVLLGLSFPVFLVRREVRLLPHEAADLPAASDSEAAPQVSRKIR